MNSIELRSRIFEIASKNDKSWMGDLSKRKRDELSFHDAHRDSEANWTKEELEHAYGNTKYYATVELSNQYVTQWLQKNVKGKIFLDYACGNGLRAIKAIDMGADLAVGIDISGTSIQNAQRVSEERGLTETCLFIQDDCENTSLPSNSVDVILCSGMLHHLDLSYAFPELRRILKPGGKILCVEALDYNPIIKAYRLMTPRMRTKWEKDHILSLKDLEFARRFFDVEEVHFWHLVGILGAFVCGHPSLFKRIMPVLNVIDKGLLKIPYLQRLAWQFTFVLKKRTDNA